MSKRIVTILVVAGAVFFLNAQTVTFNTPAKWMSLRDNNLVAKAIIDTSNNVAKNVRVKLVKVSNGKNITLKTVSFKIKSYLQDINFGKISKDIVGGSDYLKLDWSIVSNADNSGTLKPFGIMKISDNLNVKHINANGDSIFVGKESVKFSWDKKSLKINLKNKKENSFTFCFDGKNGKNAFLAYSDRFVEYSGKDTSITVYRYDRLLTNEEIVYNKIVLKTDIKITSNGENSIITIPWYDLGIIPVDGRIVGFTLYLTDKTGKTFSYPKQSKKKIPGTWGNISFSSK